MKAMSFYKKYAWKNLLLILSFLLSNILITKAQSTDKFSFSLQHKETKFVRLNIEGAGAVHVEGYDGQEITMVSSALKTEQVSIPPGFKVIASGEAPALPAQAVSVPLVTEKGNFILIDYRQSREAQITVKVPFRTHLQVSLISSAANSQLSITGIKNELEVKGNASSYKIHSISGPLIIALTKFSLNAGDIQISDIDWKNVSRSGMQVPALYVLSSSHNVHIKIPEDVKLSADVTCTQGELYSNVNFRREKDDATLPGKFKGSLNGGGIPMYVRAEFGNVFFEKE